ncbi:MAG TPA: solute carrier family 23 protein [Candidatus Binatia bacterium]|nr:solute carrier family 23 protein [Candidatus Binatia bacterium]
MAKKPADLIYGVDDKPPLTASALLGLQHVFVMTSGWVLVVVIVTTIGGSQEEVAAVLRMSMIASGVATILQSLPNSPVGSGYFCPISSGPAYVSASILAGKIGGLRAVFAMTVLSGLFEGLLARIVPRLRPLFPPEVTGLVVTMVGVELVALGCPRFLGFKDGGAGLQGTVTAVAVVTLAAMIGPTVWGKGKIKLYPVLVGLAVGYLFAYFFGVFQTERLREMLAAPMISLPRKVHTGWSFDIALLPAFLIASLASTLKSVGDLTLCQKINDADWKRTDMQSVSGGIFAGAIGTGLSGLLGGIGQSTFSSNVGLSLATGATSRSIAIPCGILMILVAFLPKLAAFFAVMPDPVMGAILVYVACYMILAGIQVITSRMLDARRIFVVGIALIFGLSVDMVPGLYRDVPELIQPLFSSSLSISTVLVVLLNLLFRLGITKRQLLELIPSVDGSQKIFAFMETQGGLWGARREVITRATAALNEFLESAAGLGLVNGTAQAQVSFDEFNLDIDIRYDGRLMQFPSARPTEQALLEDDKAVANLSGFLIRQYADRVKAEMADGQCRIQMHFDH